MKQKILIGGRYQYSPAECLRESVLYKEFRAYDKVTKRDLVLQLHTFADDYIEKLRDIKHTFIQYVFDVVPLEEQSQVALFFESGLQVQLKEALRNTKHLLEQDAAVVLKFLALAVQELHSKMVISERICAENVAFCNYSIIKIVSILYPNEIPLQSKSPEVLREERGTFASDIFSLGVILYQMLYGCYPFEGESQSDLISRIKSKKLQEIKTSSPFRICVSKEMNVLVGKMLSYYPQDRPSVQQIISHSLLNFDIDTESQNYIKPKVSILPEPFLKKYLVIRASKTIAKYDDYYDQNCYLAVSTKDREFVSLYIPDVKMFEAEPRKIESYFEKLRAIKDAYLPESCGFLSRIDDYERFRREPVIATQYCNQGDLLSYLEKRRKQYGWLSEKQIYILMYLVALGYKQMRDIGVTSIHTVNSKRIMIKNGNIKIREPGLLTPLIESRLRQSTTIDYFAPELKERGDFVELDKSDMWSYGVLFYYLLAQKLPQIDVETSSINIDVLDTSRKNKNMIGKCFDQNVEKRLTLEQIKIEGVNQDLLEEMLEEKKKQDQEEEEEEESEQEKPGVSSLEKKGKHVMFKSRKKKWCKNYNRTICKSSTNSCRLIMKAFFGLVILWFMFFGIFFVNGGIGMLKTNYYREITLQVPYNYATSLYNLTILSTSGTTIEEEYSHYSYEQFTIDLNCTENNHTMTADSKGFVGDYINGSHSVQCFFGFIYAILISIMYVLVTYKLDLPTILTDKKDKNHDNKNIYHHVTSHLLISAMLYCFFYLFALEYMIQMKPCFGLENQSYPTFTSVETLLNGDIGAWMGKVFTTIVLWSLLMVFYGILGLVVKKIFNRIYELKVMIPVLAIMGIYTLVCRVGFGKSGPLEPSWTYGMNRDLFSHYWAFFGYFPEIVMLIIYAMERLVDALFWFFLRLGMQTQEEEDIKQVEFNAKLEPNNDYQKLEKSQANIGAIENEFEIFD